MPLCGFNQKMVEGIIVFSQGLFDATIERGAEQKIAPLLAVENELREIGLFMRSLNNRYDPPTESPKAIIEMIYGIAAFAEGLFKATLSQQHDTGDDLSAIFNEEVQKLGNFLEELERQHQILRKANSPQVTMDKAVNWIDEHWYPQKSSTAGV